MKFTRKNRLPRNANTMLGLNKWYMAEFEQLGWMVLANAKGYSDKVSSYKKSIQHLANSIEHVMHEYENANHKHDLHVLHMNVVCLSDFVQKNF